MNTLDPVDPTMKALYASPCPCCGCHARAIPINSEILVDCPNMQCKGPRWDILKDYEATFTLDAALAQWERVVSLTLSRDAS